MLLDDISQLRTFDTGSMTARTMSLPQNIRDTAEAMNRVRIPEACSQCRYIVAAGMGGSGIPGDFLRAMYRDECPVPIFVHKDYGLPSFVGNDALVLVTSYSGTTEETIDAFSEAMRRGARVFGISSGDQLLSLLRENGVPHFAPPPGRTTRECFGYLLFSMVRVLERSGYIPEQSSNISAVVSLLERLSSTYAPGVPHVNNGAKRIAARLFGRMPVLYGSSGATDAVGLRWKQQLNENSKVLAHLEVLPDATHNQLVAIAEPSELTKQLCAVFLRNRSENPRLSRRIEATKSVIASRGIDVVDHMSCEATPMTSLLSQSYLGDFVSLYLAALNRANPTPTTAMSELKRALGLTDLSPQ